MANPDRLKMPHETATERLQAALERERILDQVLADRVRMRDELVDEHRKRLGELNSFISGMKDEIKRTKDARKRYEYDSQVEAWQAKIGGVGYRWSPRWWSSPGWSKLRTDAGLDDAPIDLSHVVAALVELDEPSPTVLELRFGLGCERWTLAKLGTSMDLHFRGHGLSHERTRQIEAKALRLLRFRVVEYLPNKARWLQW